MGQGFSKACIVSAASFEHCEMDLLRMPGDVLPYRGCGDNLNMTFGETTATTSSVFDGDDDFAALERLLDSLDDDAPPQADVTSKKMPLDLCRGDAKMIDDLCDVAMNRETK